MSNHRNKIRDDVHGGNGISYGRSDEHFCDSWCSRVGQDVAIEPKLPLESQEQFPQFLHNPNVSIDTDRFNRCKAGSGV